VPTISFNKLTKPAQSIWVHLGTISVPTPSLTPPFTRAEIFCAAFMSRIGILHWMRVDLLCDSMPVGKIASTNLPCAARLLLHVACKYLFVTFKLL
jgi:hypothetical protein